jgi:hypothetical protein
MLSPNYLISGILGFLGAGMQKFSHTLISDAIKLMENWTLSFRGLNFIRASNQIGCKCFKGGPLI